MISGALLLSKQETISNFFTKRLNKILIPFIFWSFIYFLYQFIKNEHAFNIAVFFKLIFTQPMHYHLWFIFSLIGAYLWVPILRPIVAKLDKKYLYYVLLLWVLSSSIIPLFEKIFELNFIYNIGLSDGYWGFMLLGYLVSQLKVNAVSTRILITTVIFCILFTAISTYLISDAHNIFKGIFYENFAPNVILSSVCFYLLIKKLTLSNEIITIICSHKLFSALVSTSFGVYFIHPMVIDILQQGYLGIELSVFSGNAILAIPFIGCLVCLISFALCFILKNIPTVNRIV
jgi:surface polysaccharide O-acyltransferase-like enzyme